MEQTKKPGDAATSEPATGITCDDLITIQIDKSTLDALLILKGKLSTVRGELFDAGMICCETGIYLTLLFSGADGVANPFDCNKDAIPDTANIPYPIFVDLLRFLCDIAKLNDISPSNTGGAPVFDCFFADCVKSVLRAFGLGSSQ